MTIGHIAVLLLTLAVTAIPTTAQVTKSHPLQKSDSECLNKALEYFQSAKYHEALLMFRKLNSKYDLNVRFKAYMGICYYYDEDYENCEAIIDSIADRLEVFAPHERSIYFYDAGESCFNLRKYDKAITYYERVILICYDNEKGDILMRLGQCHRKLQNIETGQEYFISAKAYYTRFNEEWKMKKFLEAIDNDNVDNKKN